MVLLCVIFICAVNKERTFGAGFWQSYVFLNLYHQNYGSSPLVRHSY